MSEPVEDAPELKAMEIQGMLLEAVRDRSTFTITYTFDRKPNVTDFDVMERTVNGWLCDTLRMLGAKIPRRRVFRLDLQSAVLSDDGKHDVTLTLDFAKLLGPVVRAGSGVEGTTHDEGNP